jgi:hypothetical protein
VFNWLICTLPVFVITALFTYSVAQADSLIEVTSLSAQGATDSVKWSQLGADATSLGTTFSATSRIGIPVAGSFAGATPTSVVAAACAASPCSWGGGTQGPTPFGAGDGLIWTADAGASGNGPLTLHLGAHVSGAGALIQEDAPGQFVAQIDVFDGDTPLGSFSEDSDGNGDAIYIGVIDTSGANINKVVFSIKSTTNPAGDVTDFAIDTLLLRSTGPPTLIFRPKRGRFGKVKVGHSKALKFFLSNGGDLQEGSITISEVNVTDSSEFSIVSSKTTCIKGTVLIPQHRCIVDVRFTPMGKGRQPPATLMIADDANNAPQNIPLSGKGK